MLKWTHKLLGTVLIFIPTIKVKVVRDAGWWFECSETFAHPRPTGQTNRLQKVYARVRRVFTNDRSASCRNDGTVQIQYNVRLTLWEGVSSMTLNSSYQINAQNLLNVFEIQTNSGQICNFYVPFGVLTQNNLVTRATSPKGYTCQGTEPIACFIKSTLLEEY